MKNTVFSCVFLFEVTFLLAFVVSGDVINFQRRKDTPYVSLLVQGLNNETLANFSRLPYPVEEGMSVRDQYILANQLNSSFTYREYSIEHHFLVIEMMKIGLTLENGWFYDVNGVLTNEFVDVTRLKPFDNVRWHYSPLSSKDRPPVIIG